MNPISANPEPQPSAPPRKPVAGRSITVVLTSLLLAIASQGPVLGQTINAADDGTVLKAIIVFGRHSIRSSTYTTNVLDQYSHDPSPGFPTPVGHLTQRGQQAAGLLGSYFHDYLLHEGLLTGNPQTDLARSYFRANNIERSYMTAACFGAALIPGATIPIHAYGADMIDPVFDPIYAKVAAVDPLRALAEVQGTFSSGPALEFACSGERSLLSNVLYPPGTQPQTNAAQGSVDPTTLPTVFATNDFMYTGGVIAAGGLDAMVTVTDPFVMQYADGFPLEAVGWGRFTLDSLSMQTRLCILQMNIAMRQPYLVKVQSSNAGSHVLRTLAQALRKEALGGAFGNAQSRVHVIVSSDFYVAGLAGLLGVHWLLPGYQPDFCAPGGALVFELREVRKTKQNVVRVFYTAQTFDQLRNLTPLTLQQPLATMQLLVPGGSKSATDLDVRFNTFQKLLNDAIDVKCVQPIRKENPPGLLDSPPAD